MPRFDPDYTAAYYDEYGARESARWQAGHRGRMQHALYTHHLRERVRTGDYVLDAGCGPGTFTKLILELGARVACLDLSAVQLEACKTVAPGAERYELASITDMHTFGNDTSTSPWRSHRVETGARMTVVKRAEHGPNVQVA